MHTQSARPAIRRAIIQMEKPFCTADLISRLKKQGFENKGLILEIFNEMFDEGLITYEKVTSRANESVPNDGWSFRIAS